MDDWENSSGEHPQLLHVGCWAADLNPELDADVFANEVYMNSIMADGVVVKSETGSTSRPSYCSTLGSDIDISPRRLYDPHADWDRVSTYPQKRDETGRIASYHRTKLGRAPPIASPSENFDAEPELLLQPETRPISHDQLVIEVKGIYAGLVMVEAKCIDIDERQTAAAQERDLSKKTQLKNDQWQSLIALHKQLLHEHHDFFLVSQHPAASPALNRLATKYSMPTRMWRHGIHAFLEVLRYRLPDSLEHILAFIYIAYSMMALLFETVPKSEDTWIECLGDLGRYRMAIEDDEPIDREPWSNVARFWYNKAADKSPTIGRLYHHLAILARPYSLEQLSLYTRALTYVTPFESARGSIMTLFKPVLQGMDAAKRRSLPLETVFIRAYGHLFTMHHAGAIDQFFAAVHELEKDSSYDKYIAKSGSNFKEAGVYYADANIAALFEYGTPKQGRSRAILRLVYEDARRLREEKSKFENDQAVKPQGGALTCVTPFESARGSVMALFKPILQGTDVVNRRSSSLATCFIRARGLLFTLTPTTRCANYLEDLLLGKASDFEEKGCYLAASAIAAIYKHRLFRDGLPCRTIQGVNEDTLNRSLDESEPMIAPGKHHGSATKHQLVSTFPHGPRPALDHIPCWKMKDPSCGKTRGSFWRFLGRAACKIRSSPALTLTTGINFIVPITARAIPRDISNEESGGSFPAAVIPLANWRELAFVIITLLMTQYLAHIKDPIFVWGCMMAVWAFGWLTIRADPGTTLSISVVVGLIIIILSTVTLMTPGASTAQPELLLSLSLPLVSLILAAMVNAVAAMQAAELNNALEARPQVHVPYIQEQGLAGRQQRPLRIAFEPHFRPVELPTTPGESG